MADEPIAMESTLGYLALVRIGKYGLSGGITSAMD